MNRRVWHWDSPGGVRVEADGSWHVDGLPLRHASRLRWLKRHLVFDEQGAHLVDGQRRLPVTVAGPAFEVLELTLEARSGRAAVRLDDDSEEPLADDALGMDALTGRFDCRVRGGRARALFSRGAHQFLLEHVEQELGRFFVRLGPRRLWIRI